MYCYAIGSFGSRGSGGNLFGPGGMIMGEDLNAERKVRGKFVGNSGDC